MRFLDEENTNLYRFDDESSEGGAGTGDDTTEAPAGETTPETPATD